MVLFEFSTESVKAGTSQRKSDQTIGQNLPAAAGRSKDFAIWCEEKGLKPYFTARQANVKWPRRRTGIWNDLMARTAKQY